MRLSGKIALVSGAGAGIGKATALAYAAEGAHVIAAERDASALAVLVNEAPGVQPLALDVCDDAAVAQAIAGLSRCDVLFNCVGVVLNGSVLDTSVGAFAQNFDVNVLSMIRLTQGVLPLMLQSGGGAIINVASVASSITGVANRCAYGVTKAAVIGLTKSVARDFVDKGVRCNAICPGTVDTPSLRGRASAQGDLETALAAFRARQPMGRLGTADEIAGLAVYLASDDAAFVSGQNFIIDGGWTI